jgi:hypothetical protein
VSPVDLGTPTDIGALLDRALVAILSGDVTIQQLCARRDELVIPFDDFGTASLPGFLYFRSDLRQLGGIHDTRDGSYDLTAVAEGEGSKALANALIERAELVLTEPALRALGLDAAPTGAWTRRPIGVQRGPGDDAKERNAELLELRIRITQ